MALEGLEKHQRLIESYKKLHAARAVRAGMRMQDVYAPADA